MNKYNWSEIPFSLRKRRGGRIWQKILILSALLRGIACKNYIDFILWIVFIPLEQKNNLESHKKVYDSEEFCNYAFWRH